MIAKLSVFLGGKPGVCIAEKRQSGIFSHPLQKRQHLLWAEPAVYPDRGGTERLRKHRAAFRGCAVEQATVFPEGEADANGQSTDFFCAQQRAFCFIQIGKGFKQHKICPRGNPCAQRGRIGIGNTLRR